MTHVSAFCPLGATARTCFPEKCQYMDNKMRMSAHISIHLASELRAGAAKITPGQQWARSLQKQAPQSSCLHDYLWALPPPMGDSCTGNHLFKDLNKWKPVEIHEAPGKADIVPVQVRLALPGMQSSESCPMTFELCYEVLTTQRS